MVLDGTVLEDPAERVRVAPEKRPIALMFQDYLLFPHMSAVENVAFGLRCRGTDEKTAREKASQVLARLDLEAVAEARPGSMSGGQQQRVAMARALVTDPKLLLLDEPLAALDVSIKTNVRRLLREVLRQSSAANILVTHDLLNAVALSDRMIVIKAGAIVQTGTPAEVTAPPRSTYVADLTGVNLLRGTGARYRARPGGQRQAYLCQPHRPGPTFAVIAPAAVAVSRERPEAGPEGGEVNTWRGHVSAVDLMGDRVRVRVDGTPAITAEVLPAAVDHLKLDEGGDLWVCLSPAAITTYPQ